MPLAGWAVPRLYSAVLNVVFWLQSEGALRRIWHYLNRKFTIGNIEVSVTSLVLGLIVFLSALVLARFVSSLLQRRIAARANLDPGIRYTIARLANYSLITIGLLAALKQAFGLDLTSIAVVFTALSVGIGFGLQYIAADIASGFILLFERPIRVGDRITIGDDEGDVQSIRLRTTIVYTNDRIAIIVPNSKLVSQRVINWSYGDPRARISIPVGVAPNADIDLVKGTLVAAAEGVDKVLEDPPPKVQISEVWRFLTRFSLTGVDARAEPSSADQERYQLPHCHIISSAGNRVWSPGAGAASEQISARE